MSPFSLTVHAAVAPDATPRVGGVGGAAVCARAVVWTRLTSAGTRSVRRADTAAMAIPLEAAERAAPISPHLTPERKSGHPSVGGRVWHMYRWGRQLRVEPRIELTQRRCAPIV